MNVVFILFFIFHNVISRDFYVGTLKRNDLLVAQDTMYREKVPHRQVYAKYGRLFKCPITYMRVVDRLGVGRGPTVNVVRGGLRYKYVVLRLKSPYNRPISVNIYIGCENKMKKRTTKKRILTTTSEATKVTTKSSSKRTTSIARKTTHEGTHESTHEPTHEIKDNTEHPTTHEGTNKVGNFE